MNFLVSIFLLLFTFNNYCYADATQKTAKTKEVAASTSQQLTPPPLPEAKAPPTLPDLGTCSEYTDYYIYQCQPFTCSLPLAKSPGVRREMSTLGFQGDKCLHEIIIRVRHESFRQADMRIHCALSQEGRAEMANLFTRYKKGNLAAYTNRSLGPKLKKECH